MKKSCFILILFLFLTLVGHLNANEKNRIIVCNHGLETFQWNLDFFRTATQSIELLACFFGGDVARTLLTEIELRLVAASSLQVHILASPVFLGQEDWQIIRRLQNNFPNRFHIKFSTQVAKLSPDIASVDNHVKLCVVDASYFSSGGTNMEDRNCCEGTFNPNNMKNSDNPLELIRPAGMRDQDVVGQGPLARDLRKIFYKLYALWDHYDQMTILKDNPDDFENNPYFFEVDAMPFVERFEISPHIRELKEADVKVVLGGPHQKTNEITAEYIRLIQSAKEEIVLENLYFLPIDSILNALMDAASRGIKITLITNGISDISPFSTQLFGWGNRMSYVPLFYGKKFRFWDACSVASKPIKNVEILEYHVEDVLLHKKIMIVDRKVFVVGSYNIGIKSAYGDYELILVISSDAIAKDALKVHEKDLQLSVKIPAVQACAWYFDPIISYWGEIQKKFSGLL